MLDTVLEEFSKYDRYRRHIDGLNHLDKFERVARVVKSAAETQDLVKNSCKIAKDLKGRSVDSDNAALMINHAFLAFQLLGTSVATIQKIIDHASPHIEITDFPTFLRAFVEHGEFSGTQKIPGVGEITINRITEQLKTLPQQPVNNWLVVVGIP